MTPASADPPAAGQGQVVRFHHEQDPAVAIVARQTADEARQAGETLREAYGGLCDAIEQTRTVIGGSNSALPGAAVERWVGGLTLIVRAATLVDGIGADARREITPSVSADVVRPLREALARVCRAAAAVQELSRAAERAQRRLLRTAAGDPAMVTAAARWGVAAQRLDAVTARLATGVRALEAYLDGLVHGVDHDAVRRARLARLLPALRQPADVAAADAARVVRLVVLAHATPPQRRPTDRPWRWTKGLRWVR